MPRLSFALSAAALTSGLVFATPAGADSFSCSYARVCTPDGVCAEHNTELTLIAPMMPVDNETGASDGAFQTPGTIDGSGAGSNGGERSYGVPQRGRVVWGTKLVEVFEPARDRDDSTRAFMSIGTDDYVLTVTPDLRSQLAYFVNSTVVSTLDGGCVALDADEDGEEAGDDDA